MRRFEPSRQGTVVTRRVQRGQVSSRAWWPRCRHTVQRGNLEASRFAFGQLKACRAQLEDHMVPKHVEFRSELPKTDSGKLRRSALV